MGVQLSGLIQSRVYFILVICARNCPRVCFCLRSVKDLDSFRSQVKATHPFLWISSSALLLNKPLQFILSVIARTAVQIRRAAVMQPNALGRVHLNWTVGKVDYAMMSCRFSTHAAVCLDESCVSRWEARVSEWFPLKKECQELHSHIWLLAVVIKQGKCMK
jgi:hypothetical protein